MFSAFIELVCGFVLAASGIAKLRDPRAAIPAVGRYARLPGMLAPMAGIVFVCGEVVISGALLSGIAPRVGTAVAGLLFLAFSAFGATNQGDLSGAVVRLPGRHCHTPHGMGSYRYQRRASGAVALLVSSVASTNESILGARSAPPPVIWASAAGVAVLYWTTVYALSVLDRVQTALTVKGRV